MARKKSSSSVVESAQVRLASISSINPTLDLGEGMSVVAYQALITDAQSKLSAYNTLLSQTDEAGNKLRAAEKGLRVFSERILTGIAFKYGKDSNEYEMAGGTRKSEIKHPAKKKPAAASDATPKS
jgi:hypothetical protein